MVFNSICLLLIRELKGIEMILYKLSRGIKNKKNFHFKFYLIKNFMGGLWIKLLKLLDNLIIVLIVEF